MERGVNSCFLLLVFKRQCWGRCGTFGLEEKPFLGSPRAGRSGLSDLQPKGTKVKKLCFDIPLAGDGSWAGAVGQELVTAVAWTGHGLGTPTA